MRSDHATTEPANAERLKSLFRTAHTLKGVARTLGAWTLAETAGGLEMLGFNAAPEAKAVLVARLETEDVHRLHQRLLDAADERRPFEHEPGDGSGRDRLEQVERAGLEVVDADHPVARGEKPVRAHSPPWPLAYW